MATFHLHTVFSSLQGEGRNVGRPATFIRFSGCNLACTWCDTHKDERMSCTAEQILEKVREHTNKSVIITGGEPTIQKDLGELVGALKDAGYWVALETNGVRAPSCAELFAGKHATFAGNLTFAPGATFTITDPENLETYKNHGSVTAFTAATVVGTPTLRIPDDYTGSTKWALFQKSAGTYNFGPIVGTMILLK